MWKSKVQSPKSRVRKRRRRQQTTRPTLQPPSLHASLFYLLSLLFFALGLMSKPMLVTLPFVLLLLDYWPLGRLSISTLHRSSTPTLPAWLLEKLPFFALAAASCVVTLIAQQQGGAVAIAGRGIGGVAGVTHYQRADLLCAVPGQDDLAGRTWRCSIPTSGAWPLEPVLLAAAAVGGSDGVASCGRAPPALSGRWAGSGYLGTLVPVIGLVKVGTSRWRTATLYIPSIGLFVHAGLGRGRISPPAGRGGRFRCAVGAAAVLTACALADGGATALLAEHGIAVPAHAGGDQEQLHGLQQPGFTRCAEQGELELAKKYYRSAIEIAPNYAGRLE